MTLISFSWAYNQYWCPCRFPRNLLFIVYASGGRHFFKLKNLKINNFFKI
nr:MAG TPA: hypothetical protein [Crassvirales sp.]